MGIFDFGKKADNRYKSAQKQAKRNRKLSKDLLKKAPSIDKLKANLTSAELQGLLDYEAMDLPDQIRENEALKQKERGLLATLEERSKGETQEDKTYRKQALRELASAGTAQRKAIDQDMAQRGTGSSGASLLAKLQASESARDRASQQSEQLLSRVDANKMANLREQSNLASNLQARDVNLQQGNQQARTAIQQYNLGNKMNIARSNLGMRQDIANQRANTQNQQALQHAQAYQQKYQNTAGAYGNMMQANTAVGQAAMLAPAPTSSGIGVLGGAAIGAYLNPQDRAGGAKTGAGIGEMVEGQVGREDGGILHAEDSAIVKKEEPNLFSKGVDWVNKNFIQNEEEKSEYTKDDYENATLDDKIKYKQLDELNKKDKASNSSNYSDLAKTLIGSQEQQAPQAQQQIQTPQVKIEAIPQFEYKPYQNQYAYEDGGNYYSDGGGDIVPGDSYERDRVDAKLNSGEMVLNVAQQQRLFDVIKGKIGLKDVPEGDIVEGVPKEYQEEIKDKDDMSVGFKKLLTMLGK